MANTNFFWEYDLKCIKERERIKKEYADNPDSSETHFCPKYKEKRISDEQLEKLAAYNLDIVLSELGVDLGPVSLTEQSGSGIVPLFGQRTHKLAKATYSFYNHYCFNDPADAKKKCSCQRDTIYFSYNSNKDVRYYFHLLVEKEAKFAALAKSIMDKDCPDGTIYDIGCGVSIFSLACSMMGAKNIVAMDIREEPVKETLKLASEFDVDFKCVVGDADGMLEGMITGNDLVYAGRPACRMNHWIEKVFINSPLVKKVLVSKTNAYALEKGFSGKPEEFMRYSVPVVGSEVIEIPTNLPLDHLIEYRKK